MTDNLPDNPTTTIKHPNPVLCLCGHNMGRSHCKPNDLGGWNVRCNKCKQVYHVTVKFPTQEVNHDNGQEASGDDDQTLRQEESLQ
jgi:hypothetical protein